MIRYNQDKKLKQKTVFPSLER